MNKSTGLSVNSVASSKGAGALLGSKIEGEEDELEWKLSTEQVTNFVQSLESWELNPSDITLDKELGKGSFGAVFLAKLKGQVVAVKKLLQQSLDVKSLESFKSEVEIMSKLRHPNIILFIGACTVPGNLQIAVEFMPRGNLRSLLQKTDISFRTKMLFAKQIATAMAWLHSNNPPIIHRDLKASNILVAKNDLVKISDFGLSVAKTGEATGDSTVGTPLWMAPEVLSKKPYDEKIDVYSFSLVIWEMLTRKIPYSAAHNLEDLIETVVNKEERPPIPEGTHPNLASLIKRLWAGDPTKRVPFTDIVKPQLFDLITLSVCLQQGPHEDKTGTKLWKDNFFTKEDGVKGSVSFEEFANAFASAGGIKYDAEDIKFKALRAVVARKEDKVSIEEYGALLQKFGPLNNHEEFLSAIVNLLKRAWFHGDNEEAEKIVENGKEGTFLVRFSSEPGSFTLCVKNQKGQFKRFKIVHKAGTDYVLGNSSFKSLEEIITKHHKDLGLAIPAAGSPYESLFNTKKKEKQHQMAVGYQTMDLDNM